MMSVFSAIVSVIAMIPALESFFQSLMAFYIQSQIDKMKAENLAAIKKAIGDHDQREIEKLMGSQTAGKPSGLGTIVDHISGVPASQPTPSPSQPVAKQLSAKSSVRDLSGS